MCRKVFEDIKNAIFGGARTTINLNVILEKYLSFSTLFKDLQRRREFKAAIDERLNFASTLGVMLRAVRPANISPQQ